MTITIKNKERVYPSLYFFVLYILFIVIGGTNMARKKVKLSETYSTDLMNTSSKINAAFDEIILNLQINKNNFVDELGDIKKTNKEVSELILNTFPFEVEKDIDSITNELIKLQKRWNEHVYLRSKYF